MAHPVTTIAIAPAAAEAVAGTINRAARDVETYVQLSRIETIDNMTMDEVDVSHALGDLRSQAGGRPEI